MKRISLILATVLALVLSPPACSSLTPEQKALGTRVGNDVLAVVLAGVSAGVANAAAQSAAKGSVDIQQAEKAGLNAGLQKAAVTLNPGSGTDSKGPPIPPK